MKKHIVALAVLITATTSLLVAPVAKSAPQKAIIEQEATTFIASKNGDKYHLPSCSALKRIKKANIVTFASQQEAKLKNFEPCKKCLAK